MITAQRSDLTAKRASTEEESVPKKPRVEDEDDSSMEDDSSDSYAFEVEAKDEEDVRSGGVVLDMEEIEPEWDVDSYDGREYESDPEAREFFGDEKEYQEYREHRIETWKSKGFLPDEANGIYAFGNLQYQSDDMAAHRKGLTDLVSVCVKKFNEHNEKTLEVDSLVRANVSGGAIWKLYITFMAREYENGPLVEYQAKMLTYAGDYKPPYPILCRPSPKPGI